MYIKKIVLNVQKETLPCTIPHLVLCQIPPRSSLLDLSIFREEASLGFDFFSDFVTTSNFYERLGDYMANQRQRDTKAVPLTFLAAQGLCCKLLLSSHEVKKNSWCPCTHISRSSAALSWRLLEGKRGQKQTLWHDYYSPSVCEKNNY